MTSQSLPNELEKIRAKPLEEVDVFGFFAGEVQECSNAGIVAAQHGARVIQDEGQDEFLNQPERVEIIMSSNLIEDEPLFG